MPALAWLLPLATVPVLCHLLARSRPPVYRFSSIEFLQRVVKRTARLRRPKDWLLLALRTLAMLALLLAFPGFLLLSKEAPLPGAQKTTVFLIDRSASMGAPEGAGTRFQAACAAASEWLESTAPDLANIVWIDHAPAAVFPDPGPNRAFLSDQLTRAKVRPEPGALTAAFELAWRQLSAARGARELVLISDFQDAAWRGFQPSVPPGVTIRTIPVASGAPPNVAVTSLVTVPAAPVTGQEVTLLAKVANYSPEPRRATLTIDAGGARQSRQVELPPWGESEASMPLRPGSAGLLPVTASVDADAFPADDRAHTIVSVRAGLRLGIGAKPDDPAVTVLTNLAGAVPWMEAVPADPAVPPACDIWYLPAWDGSHPDQLRELAAKGVTICVHPAGASSSGGLAKLIGGKADGPLTLQSSAPGYQISRLAEHPAFTLFHDGAFGHPFAGTFRERWTLPPALRTAGTALASWQEDAPAVLLAKGEGTAAPVIVLTFPLDPAKTDWPARSVFVPAMAELLLRTRPDPSPAGWHTAPGTRASWTAGDAPRAGAPELVAPDESVVPIQSSSGPDGEVFIASTAAVPGIYRWQISGLPVHFTAVNFPNAESDLRPGSPPAFDGAVAGGREDLARQAALDRGLPLWPWLAGAALLFLLTESFVAARRPAAAAS